jgi:integrase
MTKEAKKSRRWVGFIIRELHGNPLPFFVDVRRTGFVRRKAFATLKDAKTYCEQIRDELEANGATAFDLTDVQRLDAKSALAVLGIRCTMADAARFWAKYHPDQGGVTFNDTLARYRAWMEAQRMRPATMKGLWRLDRVARELGKASIISITTDDLTRWLDGRGFTPSNRNNYRRRLSALFAYAVNQGIIDHNPVERVHVVKVEAKPVIFWSADHVAKLLSTTDALYPKLVPMFAIMAFAGVRPGEAEALRWESINIKELIIRIEGTTSKTRSARVVPMPENLALWLTKYRGKAGPIAPKAQTLRRWRHRMAAAVVLGDVPERLVKRKGMKGTAIRDAKLSWAHLIAEAKQTTPELWPEDVLRHSYATHWLPAYKDEGALALYMGNSPAVIHKHYRGLVTEAEASAFWKIEPPQGKVIQLQRSA